MWLTSKELVLRAASTCASGLAAVEEGLVRRKVLKVGAEELGGGVRLAFEPLYRPFPFPESGDAGRSFRVRRVRGSRG